jgi:hypothetical protein
LSDPCKKPVGVGGDRIRESFERKLAVLESLAAAKLARIPLKAWYPTSLREFRAWNSPGEFDSWVSQSIDAPNGKYPNLAGRLGELLKILKSDPLEEENARLRRENTTLMQQNVQLEIAIRKLEDRVTLLGQVNNRANVTSLYKGPRRT